MVDFRLILDFDLCSEIITVSLVAMGTEEAAVIWQIVMLNLAVGRSVIRLEQNDCLLLVGLTCI